MDIIINFKNDILYIIEINKIKLIIKYFLFSIIILKLFDYILA